MSQSGTTKSSGSGPIPGNVATSYVTNSGTAIPSVNVLNVLGSTVVAGSTPLSSIGVGNTVTYQTQLSQAIASTDATKVGLAAFSSSQFSVDANGFVTFTGTATPLTLTGTTGGAIASVANNFNILGNAVAASATPVSTIGSAGTITIDIQRASAAATSVANNAGISSFSNIYFNVDANGFVSINGAAVTETLTGDTGGVLLPTAGNFNILAAPSGLSFSGVTSTLTLGGVLKLANGGTNAALTASNGGIFYSTATAGAILSGTATANQMLQSGASSAPAWSTSTWPATTTINQLLYSSSANTVVGLTTANNSVLTTTSSGVPAFVGPLTNGQLIIGSTGAQPVAATLTAGTGISITNGAGSISIAVNGSVVGETITGTTGGALSPTLGNWNILASTVAAGTTPIATSGAASTLTINVQKAQAVAAADTTKIGLANFNSAQFTVDATGFVSLSSTGPGLTITGNDANALSPAASNWNIYGNSAAAGTSPVTTTGSGSTLTINVQKSQAIASTTASKVGLAAFDSAYFTTDANGFVSINSAALTNTLTGDTGGALSPTSGNFNILAASTGLSFSGAISTLTLGGILKVTNGGTGVATMTTAYAPVCAGTTATGNLQVASTGLSNVGYVLTSTGASSLPTFQAPAGSGAIVLVSTLTAASSATLSWTGLTSNNYLLVFNSVIAATNTANLQLNISINNGSSYITTGYQSGINYSAYNSATINNGSLTTNFILSAGLVNTAPGASGSVTLMNFTNGGQTAISGTSTGNSSSVSSTYHGVLGGVNTNTSTVNAIRVKFSGGNITSGTFSLYSIAS